MSKKLTIKRVLVEVETEETPSGQIFLEEIIKVDTGFFEEVDGKKYIIHTPLTEFLGRTINNDAIFYTDDELKSERTKSSKDIYGRMASEEEMKLIIEFENKGKDTPFIVSRAGYYGYTVVFDLSDENKLAISNYCYVNVTEENKGYVNSFICKYGIKHGHVYALDEENDFEDLDEDISEIKEIIN